MVNQTLRLADFGISPITGFLPQQTNYTAPKHNLAWHQLADALPKFLPTGRIREIINQLPDYEKDTQTNAEAQMRILSYLGHAYLWGEAQPVELLPRKFATAWAMVAEQTGRPPILSYPSYCLYNFKLIDSHLPAYLGNIQIVQNFFGGADEDWFILIHVDIEARAAKAIAAIPQLLESAEENNLNGMIQGLKTVGEAFEQINETMNRMPELCDPYIYYTRVRPYIFGTKNNPAVPNGVVYEGCFDNEPQFYRGETGAQSSIVPAIDGLLGVSHENDPLKEYLMEMRTYMVPAHVRFIEEVENTSQVRQRVQETQHEALTDAYNHCVEELFRFRAKHLEYAASYIHKQALQANNSNVVGTGGTPFMEYLAKHRDETKIAVL